MFLNELSLANSGRAARGPVRRYNRLTMSGFSRPGLQHAGKAALAAVALIAALSATSACADGGDPHHGR